MQFVKEYPVDLDLCDELIGMFVEEEKLGNTFGAMSSTGDEEIVEDNVVKEGEDLHIFLRTNDPNDKNKIYDRNMGLLERLNETLLERATAYTQEFSTLKDHKSFGIDRWISLTRYSPNQSYKVWHCENVGGITSNRLLVYLIYLNTIEHGGETGFLYQNERIKAEAGRMIMFPTGFTHTHRGFPPVGEPRYVVAGWIKYVEKMVPEEIE